MRSDLWPLEQMHVNNFVVVKSKFKAIVTTSRRIKEDYSLLLV
jgi:hypothetical protein